MFQHTNLLVADEVSKANSNGTGSSHTKKPQLISNYLCNQISAYRTQSVGVFALFKFVQSVGSSVAFLYSTRLDLHYQLTILAVIATVATVCFCLVEWKTKSNCSDDGSGTATSIGIEKSESQQSIVSKRHNKYANSYDHFGTTSVATENYQKIAIN